MGGGGDTVKGVVKRKPQNKKYNLVEHKEPNNRI